MNKIKVLFVDDDILFGQTIVVGLEHHGFEVIYQTTLASITGVINEANPDIIVLDVMIGLKNSIDVIDELKIINNNIPIIFLSSLTESDNYVRALDIGAIAFLRKPVPIVELVANIKRHIPEHREVEIGFGKYAIKSINNSLYHNDKLIKELTTKEYKFLELLCKNINSTISKETIAKEVWNNDIANKHSIANYVNKLREYLAEDTNVDIETIHGVGYKLNGSYKTL